jgi:HAMP domain-containing protein
MPFPLAIPAMSFLAKPMVPWIIAGAAIVGCTVLYAYWDAADERADVAEQRAGMFEEAHKGATDVLANVRRQIDAQDAKAERQQAMSDKAVADLAAQRDAALSRAETFRTELMRKASEPGATAASVGRAALEGLRE